MSAHIADWMSGARARLLWVDYERYARRVFANAAADWYRNPVRFAGTLGQALRVIPSEVVAVDALAPFVEALGHEGPGAHERLVGFLDEAATPLQFVADVLDALSHSVGGKADVVLKLTSPRDLLRACGASDELASDFGTLDDVATAVVGLVRRLSARPLQGVQLVSSSLDGLSPDEDEACQPIFETAKYYGWATALSLTAHAPGAGYTRKTDIALFPEASIGALAALGDDRLGGGLDSGFWYGGERASVAGLAIVHGVVPEDATPETVLERMAQVLARAA